jgi:hypothetical protein
MARAYPFGQVLAIGIAAGAVVLSSAMPVQAQSATNDTEINLSGLNSRGVSEATSLKHHAFPANTPVAKTRARETSNLRTASPAATAAPAENPTRYPGDLSYQGGKVVEYAKSHPIYLFSKSAGCTTPACWGNPATFLEDLGESGFIHVTDQYTHNSANNRYTVGEGFSGSLPRPSPTAPLTDAQMASIAHQVSRLAGAGYGHIFHIFLPPGQDICITATDGICYSPDVPATFFFCAYHGSADFPDGSHVLYTVEPYQNVGGCNVQPGTPNGELVDSTMNVLSHEFFETITDPDPPTGWVNSTNNSLFGAEIGDECSFVGATSFDAPSFMIGEKKYAVQREYDNNRHACTEAP